MADMEPGLAAGLAEFFQGRVFSTRVEIAEVTDELGLVSVLGPAAEDVVRTVTLVSRMPAEAEHASVRCAAAIVVRVARPIPGLDLYVPKGALAVTLASLTAAGGTPATQEDYEVLRATHGLARDRVDFDEGFLPQEAALERAVRWYSENNYLKQGQASRHAGPWRETAAERPAFVKPKGGPADWREKTDR